MSEFVSYVLIGFVAQLIDGALGMAYGVTATSLLLSLGVPLVTASATVHVAECFTTGASGISHHVFGNVNLDLLKKLILPGMVGAILGAYILSNVQGDSLRPFVSLYLIVIGVIIVVKAFREFPPRMITSHVGPLGFFGALFDSIGGGGWGPIVASTLIARGSDVRLTIGSVNAAEFFVTVASSATFFLTIGITEWETVLALGLGGLIAAPFAAFACKHIPRRPFTIAVGVFIILLSVRSLV